MRDLLNLIRWMLLGLFRSRTSLRAENLALRHQLNVLHRSSPKRPVFSDFDRLIFHLLVSDGAACSGCPHGRRGRHRSALASRWFPPVLALEVSKRSWQAEGASRSSAADPRDEPGKSFLGRSSHPWRASQARNRCRPDLGCQVHGPTKAPALAGLENVSSQSCRLDRLDRSIRGPDDLIPTARFLVFRHDRRRILWLGVTRHPSAEWIARQVTEACGWESAPQYLVRDRDRVYGEVFTRRIRAMGIRDRPTARRSPWQNGYAERVIGSIRRECLDHVIAFGERHLRHVLRSYARYYNGARTTYRWPRTRPYPEPSRPSAAFFPCRSSADCITITSGSDLREPQAWRRSA